MDKTYEIKSGEIQVLPAEKLFGGEINGSVTVYTELFLDLCIEYGRKLALEDYIRAVNEKTYLNATEVKAILGMIGEEDE